jgi:endoglucanase
MKSFAILSTAVLATGVAAQQSAYGQCGGIGWSGATTCVGGYSCSKINDYYSQCVPGSGGGGATPTSSPPSQTSSPGGGNGGGNGGGSGRVQYAGVNVAGFDFGCGIDGTCDTTSALPPLSQYNGQDGVGQMNHFVRDDGMNIFRLPVGWQWLVNNKLGGNLDATNFGKYDALVQGCLQTGATCIIDIHNYARWNGQIIGQGGPSEAQFVNIWEQLATKYAGVSKIAFGVMNEPHDVDINKWAATVQKVVTAIRGAGAKTQLILLPGNNFTSAETYVSNGSLAALQKVTNPDGSTTNLIFDVHKYLDSDNSGTHTECVKDNVSTAFSPLATALRAIKRQAILSETGGGNTASCQQYLCSEISFLK